MSDSANIEIRLVCRECDEQVARVNVTPGGKVVTPLVRGHGHLPAMPFWTLANARRLVDEGYVRCVEVGVLC